MKMSDLDLRAILSANLDDENDAHWTDDDGLPRLDAARLASGIATLTREEIALTGIRRREAKTAPPAASTAEAVDQAAAALQVERDRVIRARENLIRTRKAQADSIMAWTATYPVKSAEDVHRANIAREQERKLRIARGEIAPDAVEQPRYLSPIDAVMAGGRGSSINIDYRRKPGRLIQPKVPSER
jgi:hypothetical protein